MILLGVAALQSRDKDAVSKLYEMDDIVDTIYRNYLRNVFTSNSSEGMSPRCCVCLIDSKIFRAYL